MIKDRVQIQNPRSKCWLKVDTRLGRIIGFKMDGKPWKNIQKKKRAQLKKEKISKLDLNKTGVTGRKVV